MINYRVEIIICILLFPLIVYVWTKFKDRLQSTGPMNRRNPNRQRSSIDGDQPVQEEVRKPIALPIATTRLEREANKVLGQMFEGQNPCVNHIIADSREELEVWRNSIYEKYIERLEKMNKAGGMWSTLVGLFQDNPPVCRYDQMAYSRLIESLKSHQIPTFQD